jgi:hypothetical protein
MIQAAKIIANGVKTLFNGGFFFIKNNWEFFLILLITMSICYFFHLPIAYAETPDAGGFDISKVQDTSLRDFIQQAHNEGDNSKGPITNALHRAIVDIRYGIEHNNPYEAGKKTVSYHRFPSEDQHIINTGFHHIRKVFEEGFKQGIIKGKFGFPFPSPYNKYLEGINPNRTTGASNKILLQHIETLHQ